MAAVPPVSKSFNFTVDNGNIALCGMVDRFTVGALLKGIDLGKIDAEQLVVDFSAVERVDTAGLAWLLKMLGQARTNGQCIALKALPEQLLNLARTSGVEQLLQGDQ